MHFLALIQTLILLTSSALATPAPSTDDTASAPIELSGRAAEPEAAALEKRACTCAKVSNAGLYCGYCYLSGLGSYAVKTGRNSNHVYWCNKQGGCEDFGTRTSCVNGAGPCDGRDS